MNVPITSYLLSLLLLAAGTAVFAGSLMPGLLPPALGSAIGATLLLLGLHRFFGSPIDPHLIPRPAEDAARREDPAGVPAPAHEETPTLPEPEPA